MQKNNILLCPQLLINKTATAILKKSAGSHEYCLRLTSAKSNLILVHVKHIWHPGVLLWHACSNLGCIGREESKNQLEISGSQVKCSGGWIIKPLQKSQKLQFLGTGSKSKPISIDSHFKMFIFSHENNMLESSSKAKVNLPYSFYCKVNCMWIFLCFGFFFLFFFALLMDYVMAKN